MRYLFTLTAIFVTTTAISAPPHTVPEGSEHDLWHLSHRRAQSPRTYVGR